MLSPIDQTQASESNKQQLALIDERIQNLQATLSELRTRLEFEIEERRHLSIQLAQAQANSQRHTAPTPWVLYVIGLSTLTAAAVSILHLVKA
mgnify:CR=1 FL=1